VKRKYPDWIGRNSLFTDDLILYVENLKGCTHIRDSRLQEKRYIVKVSCISRKYSNKLKMKVIASKGENTQE
jgi:hypothetical protein